MGPVSITLFGNGVFTDVIKLKQDYTTLVKVEVQSFSCVQLFATPWTVAYQAPSSMGFSRQEYWRGLPFPSPGSPDLPNSGIEPRSPALQADALTSEPPGKSYYLRVGTKFLKRREKFAKENLKTLAN